MPQYIQIKPQSPPAELPDRSKNHHRRRLPTLSLVLTALSTICIAGCITVIYTARGKPVDDYLSFAPVIRPTVLLAALSSISSIIRKYLFAEGVAVVWWRAISNGATLADLHFIWSQGKASGFKDTLKHLFRHRSKTYWLMAVFIFMTAVSIADGPLLQQAIHPVPRNLTTNYLEPEMGLEKVIHDGWAGEIDNTAPSKMLSYPALGLVLQQWYQRLPLPYPRCENGTCSGSIVAAGLSTKDARTELEFIDLTAPEHQNATVFSIELTRDVDSTGHPVLLMNHSYLLFATGNCNASIISEIRTFQVATVEYDVFTEGSDLYLNSTRWPQVLKEEEEASKGDRPGDDKTLAGPLAALEYFGYYYLRTFGHSTMATDGSIVFESSAGPLVNIFEVYHDDSGPNACVPTTYRNATSDLTWHLHEVMFRMAWNSTNGTDRSSCSRKTLHAAR